MQVTSELSRSLRSGLLCTLVLLLGLLSRDARTCHRRTQSCWQPDLVDQIGAASVPNPEVEGLAHALTSLLDRSAITVAAWDARHLGNPGSALVTVVHDLVFAHLNLRSHLSPRHGSKSRSICRSVLGADLRLRAPARSSCSHHSRPGHASRAAEPPDTAVATCEATLCRSTPRLCHLCGKVSTSLDSMAASDADDRKCDDREGGDDGQRQRLVAPPRSLA